MNDSKLLVPRWQHSRTLSSKGTCVRHIPTPMLSSAPRNHPHTNHFLIDNTALQDESHSKAIHTFQLSPEIRVIVDSLNHVVGKQLRITPHRSPIMTRHPLASQEKKRHQGAPNSQGPSNQCRKTEPHCACPVILQFFLGSVKQTPQGDTGLLRLVSTLHYSKRCFSASPVAIVLNTWLAAVDGDQWACLAAGVRDG
jgi:hypothetical protein